MPPEKVLKQRTADDHSKKAMNGQGKDGGTEGFCYTSFTEIYSKAYITHIVNRVRAKTLDYLSPMFTLLCSLYSLYQEILVLIIARQCSKFSKLGFNST